MNRQEERHAAISHTVATFLVLSVMMLAACAPMRTPVAPEPYQDSTTNTERDSTASEGEEAVSEADLALFHEKAGEASGRMMNAILSSCPEAFVPGMKEFPLAEPAYNNKRTRDLSPFAQALEAFTAERAAELDALLAGKDIPAIQALMDAGELNAVELVTYDIDRIQRYDIDKLNAVLTLNPDALSIAAHLDEERASGAELGPLHGIPVMLKDNIATGDGMTTTAGAYALKDWQPERDAFLVQQLRDAGAIILGKTNLSEWANYMDPCMPNGFSTLGGQTRHPYGPFDPLGSSSGSAVSVAANLTTASVGSETSGSIIQPARVNSIVALRPSLGLISRDMIVPLADALDTPGPMGRSLMDVAIMLNVMAGVDENDHRTADAAALADVDFTKYLSLEQARRLRVGVILPTQEAAAQLQLMEQLTTSATQKELSDADRDKLLVEVVLPKLGGDPNIAIQALKAQGVEVVEIPDDTLPPSHDTAQVLLPYAFQHNIAAFFTGMQTPAPITSLSDVVTINNEDPDNRMPYGQRYVEWSADTEFTADDYARILMVARQLAENWIGAVLEENDVDVLVSGMSYTGNAGAANIPALTIPAGLDPSGKPQGVVLTGAYLSEPSLFAVGYALEEALHGRVEPDLDSVSATFPEK